MSSKDTHAERLARHLAEVENRRDAQWELHHGGVRLNAKGQRYTTGEKNRLRQWFTFHHFDGARAVYRRGVIAKRNAQMESLYGAPLSGGFLSRFWQTILRFVVRMTPTVRRLERERRTAQEVKHRFSRTKYANPVVGRRHQMNTRRAG